MNQKKILMRKLIYGLGIFFALNLHAQGGGWKPELEKNSKEALNEMMERSPKLKTYYEKAYGYAIYPKITKAGLGIGGAGGQGIVFRNHIAIGSSSLKQASFGLQAGGQQYSEVIFFENQKSFEHFTNGNLKFDAQASAVALTEGASYDVAYKNGVAVFTNVKGGLMLEASIGGQHFSYKEGKKAEK
jgi:lipid-binding SYLF domain-containing protein